MLGGYFILPHPVDDGSPRFRRQTVRVEVRTGVIVKKNPEFCSVGGARSKTAFFAFLVYPSTILRTVYCAILNLSHFYCWHKTFRLQFQRYLRSRLCQNFSEYLNYVRFCTVPCYFSRNCSLFKSVLVLYAICIRYRLLS